MADRLYGRTYQVTVGAFRLTGIRLAFEVERSLAHTPNRAEIKLYNLTELQRRHLSALDNPPVALFAGYASGNVRVFTGQLTHVEHEIDPAGDTITTISSGDGTRSLSKARINLTFGSGTGASNVLRSLATSLGVKAGNLRHAEALLAGKVFATGTVVSGHAATEMTSLCRSCGLEWSVQDGELQILERGKARNAQAILLSPDTGLVGSPTLSGKKVLTAKALIIAGLIPGCVVDVRSKFIKGQYRAEKIQYSGDTHGQDWYATIEGKKL